MAPWFRGSKGGSLGRCLVRMCGVSRRRLGEDALEHVQAFVGALHDIHSARSRLMPLPSNIQR